MKKPIKGEKKSRRYYLKRVSADTSPLPRKKENGIIFLKSCGAAMTKGGYQCRFRLSEMI
jgi:hypothetical protein